MKVLYSGVYADDGYPFNSLLDSDGIVVTATKPDDLNNNDSALVIWGGADINPQYDKHPMHSTTHPP